MSYEHLKNLQLRIARLEKESANPLLVSSSRNYLVNDFEYKEEIENDKRQLAKEIQSAMMFDYNKISIKVKDVKLVDGGVEFEFTGSASVPAKVIPAPFSVSRVFKGLHKILGMKVRDDGDTLSIQPEERTAFGRTFYDSWDDFDGPIAYFELKLKNDQWVFNVALEQEGIFSEKFDSRVKSGFFNFSAKSTGNNKKDIELLHTLLEEAYTDIHTS